MPHRAAVPFHLKRSQDTYSGRAYTSTTETVHGLLRLEGDELAIQWRLSRRTDHVGGASYHTEEELESVREIILPLAAVAGATVRRPWWGLGTARLALRAADLRAFEGVTGEGGLKLAHPAELVFRLRREDVLAAEEFAAELALALAERSLAQGHDRDRLPGGGSGALPPVD